MRYFFSNSTLFDNQYVDQLRLSGLPSLLHWEFDQQGPCWEFRFNEQVSDLSLLSANVRESRRNYFEDIDMVVRVGLHVYKMISSQLYSSLYLSLRDGSLYIDDQLSPSIDSAHQDEGLTYVNSSSSNFEYSANLVIDTYMTIRRSTRLKDDMVQTKWDECEEALRHKDPLIGTHEKDFWSIYISNL